MDEIIITVEANLDKKENSTFEELVAGVYEMAMRLGQELVKQALEERDEELRKTRDKRRYRCKGKQQTSIKTRLGVIEYRRNVYVDNSVAEGNKCVHLLDEELGIERIGQIAKEVCEAAGELVCECSYRTAAKTITENTGLSISPQGVWNIVQKLGEKRSEQVERHTELAGVKQGVGCVQSKILYEEDDGIWLKLQGKDREECGASKEMKVGIAYDGVTWEKGKGGKKRRTLDGKVAHASFDPAKKFRENKDLLTCIEAQRNATEDQTEQDGLRELLTYYTENKNAMTGPYERGSSIPDTREPGVIHHARLGSMESNIFTLIGNRMKDRRCCWSIQGANHLASLLCLKHTTGLSGLFSGVEPMPEPEGGWADTGKPISASKMPTASGRGTVCYNRTSLPNIPWLKDIVSYRSLSDLNF